MRTLSVVVALCGVFAPTPSLSQSYCDPRADAACYQRWCSSQGGRPIYRGNWGCDMSGARGSYSGGGGGAGAVLGRQIGGVLGELIREGLFGNPQREAARQAEMEEQRALQEQENQRIAAEQARQDEDRYQRLRSSLLGVGSGPQLSLMGAQPGGGGLQVLTGEEAERSVNPALAELARAAAWSTLAARASTPEDAAVLADAAFQSVIGGKVNLPPPPPDVKGVPVHPFLPEVEPLKKQYLELRSGPPNAVRPVVEAEQRKVLFTRLEREALEMERTEKAAARRAQARDAARQARELREKAEADLRTARADFERLQYKANDVERGLRALLSSMAALPRKPDSYFYLGFEDASQCFSQNSGPRCDKARALAAEFELCLANYRLGYTAGEKVRKQLLEHAHQSGGRDGQSSVYAITDSRAEGACRYDYVVSYNRGFFDTSVGLGNVAQAPDRKETPAPRPAARRAPSSEVERIINGITASAKEMGLTAKEQVRLKDGLNSLDLVGAGAYEPERITESWANIEARMSSGEVAREAARGDGPGLAGVGTQIGQNDCAIFALATVSGQPYGVVAARATKLISEGEWRSASDRSSPQRAISQKGLNGGEVVLLAEAFGRADIVKPTEFVQTLKAGRPVMVSVVPSNGDINNGHQVVLAKTFQRGVETWYEVIDSTRGPMRRLYMSATELNFLIKENGIAYRPEPKPGTTPDLLRVREGGR